MVQTADGFTAKAGFILQPPTLKKVLFIHQAALPMTQQSQSSDQESNCVHQVHLRDT